MSGIRKIGSSTYRTCTSYLLKIFSVVKEVPWPKYRNAPEFKEISVNIAKELEQYFGYTAENAYLLEAEVASLLNHPRAIQEKASLKRSG